MAHEWRRAAASASAAALDAAEDALFVDIAHEAPLSCQRQSQSIVGGTLYCILLAGYAGVAIAAPWIFVLIPEMTLPLLCSCNVLLIVTGYIHKFNSLNEQPDILKPFYSALRPSSSLEGLRYYDSRLSDQQMALLQYQRENIHYLSEEVLRLQECSRKYHTSVASCTPQVDLAHLLASRDQELRALSSEMNQVHLELRLARGLIAEKDSDIQHIRVNNNQYIEENERLRAILGEWSARAAMLERALEAERVSNMELRKNYEKRGQSTKEKLRDIPQSENSSIDVF